MGGTWAFARQAAPRGTGAPEPTAELLRWGTPQQNSWESLLLHRSLNVPIEHHPTIRYMVYNGYYKVMSNIPKMGQLPTPVLSPRIDWIDDSVVSSMIKGDHCRFRLCFWVFDGFLGSKVLSKGLSVYFECSKWKNTYSNGTPGIGGDCVDVEMWMWQLLPCHVTT